MQVAACPGRQTGGGLADDDSLPSRPIPNHISSARKLTKFRAILYTKGRVFSWARLVFICITGDPRHCFGGDCALQGVAG
jgi:hypothetical protein